MKGEHLGPDAVLKAACLDQASGQACGFALRHHPSGDVAAEDVQDHVEVEVLPLPRSKKPG